MKKRFVAVFLAAAMAFSSVSYAAAEDLTGEEYLLPEDTGGSDVESGGTEDGSFSSSWEADMLPADGETEDQEGDILQDETEAAGETETETYAVDVQADHADVFFASDLEKLRNGTLTDPEEATEGDFSSKVSQDTSAESSFAASVEAAKAVLPDDVSGLLTEDSYRMLMEQDHSFSADDMVGFYVVPADGYETASVTASSIYGDLQVTDYGNGAYEVSMPASDLMLDVQTKEKEETPVDEETEMEAPEDVEVETESETEPETETSVECTCLSDSEDPYQHDWDCPVFWEAFQEDCSCGELEEKVTSHEFDCTAFRKALAAICNCETGDTIGMHDDCEVILRMHQELCDCGEEYTSIDAIVDSHGEDSAIVKYLMAWADYCNQPATLASTVPITRVKENSSANNTYAYSFAYTKDTELKVAASNGGYVGTINDVEDSCNLRAAYKNKGATYRARYTNVGMYKGKSIDFVFNLNNWGGVYEPSGGKCPSVNFYPEDIGFDMYNVKWITMKAFFVYSTASSATEDNAVTALKWHATYTDIDGAQGIRFSSTNNSPDHVYTATYDNRTWNDKPYFLTYSTPSDTQLLIRSPGGDTSLSDKFAWVQADITGKIGFTYFQNVDDPNVATPHNTVCTAGFSAKAIGLYTDSTPNKRVGDKGSAYAGMEAHDTKKGAYVTSIEDTYTYGVEHEVMPGTYTTYKMYDPIDACLTYVENSGKVRTESGTNVTGWFNITTNSKNEVVFTATSDALKKAAFYNKQKLYFIFNVKVADKETVLAHHPDITTSWWYFDNVAHIYLTRDGSSKTLDTGHSYVEGKVRGKYYVTKVDSVDKKKLEGAAFELQERQSDGTYAKTKDLTYNSTQKRFETGTLTWTSSNQGKFKIVETTAPDGYTGGWTKSFNIGKNKYPDGDTFEAANTFKPRVISVNKIDGTTKKRLSDAAFDIYEAVFSGSTSTFKKIGKLTFNPETEMYDTPELSFTASNRGMYRIVETTAPAGYVCDWSFDIKDIRTCNSIIEAENFTTRTVYGTITIIKRDSVTKEVIDSKDAEFQVYQWNDDKQTYVNDLGSDGKITYDNLNKKYISNRLKVDSGNHGKFKVVETKNPTGYKGSWSKTVQFDEAGDDLQTQEEELEALNTPTVPKLGQITVTKKIKESEITWAHGNPIFRFMVRGTDANGQAHTYEDQVEFREGNYAVDANGYAYLSLVFDVPIGTYRVYERESIRYALQDVWEASSNMTVSIQRDIQVPGGGWGCLLGQTTLTASVNTAKLTAVNKKTKYDRYSHTDVVKNTIAIEW